MDSRLLALLQLCDSNFPAGAFSHSFGLETYIQDGQVHNKATFAHWLRVYLYKQLVYTDGLTCRLAYEALEQHHIEKVWEIDRMITVQNIPRESREGSRRMGERMIRLGRDVFSVPLLTDYQERIAEKRSFGHPAVVFAMIAHFFVYFHRENGTLLFIFMHFLARSERRSSYSVGTNGWPASVNRISTSSIASKRIYQKNGPAGLWRGLAWS